MIWKYFLLFCGCYFTFVYSWKEEDVFLLKSQNKLSEGMDNDSSKLLHAVESAGNCSSQWFSFNISQPSVIFFFHFLDGVLWSTNAFNFDEVPVIYSLGICAFSVMIYLRLQRFTPMFSSKSLAYSWALSFRSVVRFELTVRCLR